MRRLAVLALATVCAVAACSDDKPSVSSSSSSSPTPAPPPATLTITGDPGLAGPMGEPSVTCSFPSTDGLRLAVLGQAADGTSSYRLAVGPDRVVLHVDSNDNGTFVERNFEGTGVSDFDPAQGATIDATLTEAAPTAGTGTGSIGNVTSIKGTINCVDQSPGTSTITLTGDTEEASYNAALLQPAIVECTLSNDEVIVLGVAEAAGGQRQLFKVSLSFDGLGLDEELEPSGKRLYSAGRDAVDLTPSGGSANGDVVEKDSAAPHTLHVEGDAVCGTPRR